MGESCADHGYEYIKTRAECKEALDYFGDDNRNFESGVRTDGSYPRCFIWSGGGKYYTPLSYQGIPTKMTRTEAGVAQCAHSVTPASRRPARSFIAWSSCRRLMPYHSRWNSCTPRWSSLRLSSPSDGGDGGGRSSLSRKYQR